MQTCNIQIKSRSEAEIKGFNLSGGKINRFYNKHISLNNLTHSKLINLEINFDKSLENALNPDNVDQFFLLIMGMVIFCKSGGKINRFYNKHISLNNLFQIKSSKFKCRCSFINISLHT
jgi:hypothetical protein